MYRRFEQLILKARGLCDGIHRRVLQRSGIFARGSLCRTRRITKHTIEALGKMLTEPLPGLARDHHSGRPRALQRIVKDTKPLLLHVIRNDHSPALQTRRDLRRFASGCGAQVQNRFMWLRIEQCHRQHTGRLLHVEMTQQMPDITAESH